MKTKLIRFFLEMTAIYGYILAVRWPLDHAYDAATEILAILVSGVALAAGFSFWKWASHYNTVFHVFSQNEVDADARLRTAMQLIKLAEAHPLPKKN